SGRNRLGNDAVLVHRLVVIGIVIGDNVAIALRGVGELSDIGGEIRLAALGRGEREPGAGGQVVDDLHHRPAFVTGRVFVIAVVLNDLDAVGQFTVRDVGSRPAEVVVTVA